jgi:RimJ/RimL family protein N-acetyltransferase
MLLQLRDVTEDDLPILFEHQREPEANRMAAFPARDRGAFMEHWRTKLLGNADGNKLAIVVDGNVVGNIVSWRQDGRRLVGYWLGSAYWSRGIATAALAKFLAGTEKERPLYAFVAAHNAGSIRVLEKCGFQRSGEPIVGHDDVEEWLMQLS